MRLKKIVDTLFLLILSVFINFNIVDDRFVAPLEDLATEYHSFELEETTRVISLAPKKQNAPNLLLLSSFSLWEAPSSSISFFIFSENEMIQETYLIFFLISLPPPTLA
ncbi:hypothetical protein LPTSP3_g12530 [Leptospira kobayashii]|uniref:Uncharacterized protein n=1 Tax=Leptospira kobayashii TaxID=1917830 RepID=A0ABM7UR40_9LEPT|nr:hypothetical protein [Leptospira kobayashii]BDA78323.1 hypothetical protein LPTSP3_g12530 [Leptospira kobayashii]